ncbi:MULTISPECIES: PadR family transcriptional regulator [Actinomadura]|uniref:PadR family transcriptional regulator n=1 Tax=Actinomadura litoris TaxID=2678616 RepID=A0A7K1LE98_9ACTN|nr:MULTISPECIES: PadR family transcriptional regulator [Actinomadura]MBT2213622.1 PadR family transcriptional regulator [Actinomadura sp. NEAU-AAG7]MUN42761.1 PadR family transcriptional regulator [Actinomadura litoris]
MSIRHGLLALLAQGPRYGYQLRAEFETSTGATWPLNIGQVYSTLSRLERDEMVTRVGADDEGRFVYRITPAGERDVLRWFATPIARGDRPRDELAIKLAMAVTTPGVDVRQVVQTQRTASLRALQDFTRLKAEAPRTPADQGDTAWRLVLESMIFQAEAEVRWLDHCESFVARALPPAAPPGTAADVADLPSGSEEARR